MGLGEREAGERPCPLPQPVPGALPRRAEAEEEADQETLKEREPCARVCRTRATRRVFFALFPPKPSCGHFSHADIAECLPARTDGGRRHGIHERLMDALPRSLARSLGPRTGSLPENVNVGDQTRRDHGPVPLSFLRLEATRQGAIEQFLRLDPSEPTTRAHGPVAVRCSTPLHALKPGPSVSGDASSRDKSENRPDLTEEKRGRSAVVVPVRSPMSPPPSHHRKTSRRLRGRGESLSTSTARAPKFQPLRPHQPASKPRMGCPLCLPVNAPAATHRRASVAHRLVGSPVVHRTD